MGITSRKKAKEVYDYATQTSNQAASEKYNIKIESVRRYKNFHQQNIGTSKPEPSMKILDQVRKKFTDKELKAILKGGLHEEEPNDHKFNFSGEVLTIGLMGDTHLGSKYTDTNLINEAFNVFAEEDVDFICHTGDVFEGLSNRPGHVYECTHIGYDNQLEHGIDIFSQWQHTPVYMIDGNHDRWYQMSGGAKIVKSLAKEVDNVEFLGHDEGDIQINGITVKLWHGLDSSSYALSYRPQKLIESLTGGEKPNVLFCGHTHKSTYLFERHIHCISSGSIQKQSKWMRGKRIAAHTGFWLVKMAINDSGVAWLESRFYPAYI